jgi:hypothetical protein
VDSLRKTSTADNEVFKSNFVMQYYKALQDEIKETIKRAGSDPDFGTQVFQTNAFDPKNSQVSNDGGGFGGGKGFDITVRVEDENHR